MENEHWTEIRGLLSESSNTPELVIDYLSVLAILKMCVQGLGVMKIAYFTDLEWEQVENILFMYFGMKGWLLDLDLNPWQVYCTTQGNYELYEMKILSLTNLVDYDIIHVSYKICEKYKTIQEEIQNYD